MELTLTFNLGDRVRVTKGKAANKTGTVAGFDGSKVLVQSDNFPDAPPRRFDAAWLTPVFDSGEHSSPGMTQDATPRYEDWELCSPEMEQVTVNAGEQATPPTVDEDRGVTLAFLDHPFPLSNGSASSQGTVVPQNGRMLGNVVPQDGDRTLLEQLIYKHHLLAQSDTLRDRWLHEEASETRTRYRLRWREGGRLKSQEITKEEWENYRDRILRGQMLGTVRTLIRLLLEQAIPGREPEALARRRAIEVMIEGNQPISTILATIETAP